MKVRFEWTNWTFGIWWGPFSKSRSALSHFGIDIGPLEIVWSWHRRR